jgi:outer membrane protein assembly factor BamB
MHVARCAVVALAVVAIVAAASSASAAAPQPVYTVCNNAVGGQLVIDTSLSGSFVCATATNLQRIDSFTGNVVWISPPYPNGTATWAYEPPVVIARAGVIFYSGAAYSIATGNLIWRVPAAASECATQFGAPYVDATQRVLAVACEKPPQYTWAIYSLDPNTGKFINDPLRFNGGDLVSGTRVGANTAAFIRIPDGGINVLINYDIPRGRLLWSRPSSAPNGLTILPGDANWTLAEATNLDAFDRSGRKVWSVPASAVNALLNFKTVTGAYRTIGLDAAGHAVLWDQGTGQQLWRSPSVLAANPSSAQTTLASPGVVAIKTASGVVWGIDVTRAVPQVTFTLNATVLQGSAATVVPIATLPGALAPPYLIAADSAQNVYKIDKSGATNLIGAVNCSGANLRAFVPATPQFVIVSSRCYTAMLAF